MGNSTFPRNLRGDVLALLTLLALAAGCNHAPKVRYQFDSTADFSAFKTYAVEPTHSPTLDLRVLDGKPMTEVIAASIERQLNAKGLSKTSAASADLHVRWVGQIAYDEANGDVATPGVDLGQDKPDSGAILDSGPAGGEGVPYEVAVGGIRVDLIAARANKTVWRGGVGAILKPGDPDPKRIERVNAALASLFANYPPPPHPPRK